MRDAPILNDVHDLNGVRTPNGVHANGTQTPSAAHTCSATSNGFDDLNGADYANGVLEGLHASQFDSTSHDPSLEPIAVVGMSCRLPGGASDPSKLWELLANGTSAWSQVPSHRFNMEAFHDARNVHAGTTNTSGAHFLTENVAAFDAPFFGINPVEANAIDPQQRLLMEIAFEAFENAGVTMSQLWGSNTGVYVGQWSCDYAEVLARDPEFPALYHTTGVGPAITSNRVSYFFNLRGPSFTVDTGCSASLVALHNAVQSLRAGETEMSFVGGVNLLLDPQRFTYQSKLKMFSPDGRSFSFDSRANGYGRGEGCCGVVLKPLSAALRDNDRIRAVIRNSFLNQDGRTPGISVPSGQAQEEAMKAAYAGAGLTLNPDYVEAHGTGTSVGDPIEVGAIAAVLSKHRSSTDGPLPIGSIKGNIGHTESAAGLAGLIKSVLMLEKQSIPPQVNYTTSNPKILLNAWNLHIPTEVECRKLRRISLNSFGYGGTNAHVVLDRAQEYTKTEGHMLSAQVDDVTDQRPRLFIISAADKSGCQVVAKRLAEYVTQHTDKADSELWMDRLAFTINKRSIHMHRASVLAYDKDDLLAQLAVLAQTSAPAKNLFEKPRMAYIFSGQGAQYWNMGRELINTWPVFTQSLRRANTALQALGCNWDLESELLKDEDLSRLDNPSFGQPMSTAIQLALVDTLADLGASPTAVVGHSSGEIAAAYAAYALSFEDAMSVSYHRGRLTGQLIAKQEANAGAMLAVGLSAKSAETYIQNLGRDSNKVKIACYNSPSNVTISGDATVVQQLSQALEADSVFNRVLRTNGAAYHSDQMRQIEREYHEALKDIRARPALVRMVSSLTGYNTGQLALSRDYWVRNLVSPVLFVDALKHLSQGEDSTRGVEMLLEIGAHPQLVGAVKQTLKALGKEANEIEYSYCLKRKTDARGTLLTCIGDLYSAGIVLDLHLANNGFEKRQTKLLVDLPRYPFNHDRSYWHESRLSTEYKNRQFLPHELLGNLSADLNALEPRWRRYLRLKELPWLQNHVVQGQIVFPAAGYLTMALEAVRRQKLMHDPSAKILSFGFRNVSFGKALVISEDKRDHEISLSLRPEARTAKDSWNDWMEFRVFTAAPEQAWTEHCRGRVRVHCEATNVAQAPALEAFVDKEEKRKAVSRSSRHVSTESFYHLSREQGLEWYEPFKNLISIQCSANTCFAVSETPELDPASHPAADSAYVMHPGMLDASLFHGICAILFVGKKITSTIVPTFIKDLVISADFQHVPGSRFNTYAISHDDGLTFNALVGQQSEDEERLLLRADGLQTSKLPGTMMGPVARDLSHESEWVTYCEAMGKQRRDEICKKELLPGTLTQVNQALDATVLRYVQAALKHVQPDQVAKGYQRHYYAWMQTLAAAPYDPSLLAEHGSTVDMGVAGLAVNRLGSNLAALLTGAVDPISLMVKDDLLSKVYSEERNERCYLQIKAYCAELGRQNPALKVLEIGGGTASASLPILQAARRQGESLISSYDFTDVSHGFFEPAKERLAEFSAVVNYRVLDIERDVGAQGFEEGSYDLVIACNVIHATSDISSSMKNARALLRPGGTLILMEITTCALHYSMVFGAFPGWWAGSEEGRKTSPLLQATQWTEKLQEHGYAQTERCFSDYEDCDGGTISVFVAKASEPHAMTEPLPVHIIGDPVKAAWSLSELATRLRDELKIRSVALSELPDSTITPGAFLILSHEICESLSRTIDERSWKAFQHQLLSCKAVLMLTRGGVWDCSNPDGGVATGFARCFRLEHPDIRCVTLDFDANTTDCRIIAQLLSTLLASPTFDLDREAKDVDSDFAARDGQLYVNRIFHAPRLEQYMNRAMSRADLVIAPFLDPNRAMRADLGNVGLLETFRWADDPSTSRTIEPDEIRFELRAASINFRDVLVATGQVEGLTEMKNDCSGIVIEVGSNMTSRYRKGDRICSYYAQSYNNYPIVHGDCCAVIGENISFDVGASLPIVWATTYYSLIDIGRLRKDETVLVHAGAGAVGQAAIMLAHHLGAEVFATAGSAAKREMLVRDFGVAEDHVFSSRTTEFGPGIKAMTAGKGVNVVLNSLSGDIFRESCDVLALFGRFIEIGKKDFLDDALMPTKFLLRNITFACVDLTMIIDRQKDLAQRLLKDVVDLITSGAVKPTMISSMPITEIETAFRNISAGKHVGKVILTVSDDQHVKAIPTPPPQAQLIGDGLYLIVGGLGGLGRSIISWMADRGAKSILTLSRSGAGTNQAAAFIDEMKYRGVSVIAKRCDISSEKQVKDVLSDLARVESTPPIRGVIHAAMALEDAMFETMTYEQWQCSLGSKVAGTWNLHNLLPTDLDHFILLSSIVSISGHAGQSNYAAACSFQDSFAHYRQAQGLAAYSINVGPVSDAGFVSENPHVASAMRRQGFGAVSTAELLAQIDYVLARSHAARCQSAIGLVPSGGEAGLGRSAWIEHVRHRHLARQHQSSTSGTEDTGDGKGVKVIDALRGAKTIDDAEELSCRAIMQQLSKLIATPVENISPARSLDNYGVDSLVAVELRNWIGLYLQANIPLLVLRETKSIQQLAKVVTKDSRLVSAETKTK